MRTQLATLLPRRKEAFEEKYPHTKRGVAQGAGKRKTEAAKKSGVSQVQLAPEIIEPKADAFVKDTAKKTGKEVTSIKRAVRRGKIPNIAKLEKTPLEQYRHGETGCILDNLVEIDAPAQRLSGWTFAKPTN